MQTLIKCGKLYDGIVDDLQENMDVLVEGKLIKAVGRNLKPDDADATVIELPNLTVTPGLIDAHIHSNIDDWRVFWTTIRSDAYYTLTHLHTAQRELERGFTTLRCHGVNSVDYGLVDVRNMIDAGFFPAARLNVAAHLFGTEGSHIDPGQNFRCNPAMGLREQLPCIGSGADFFKAAVRNEIKYGSDFIKLFLSGGFSTPNDGPEDQQMDDEEIAAVLNTANALRVPSTAHVYAPKLMQKLMRNRITGMEHGSMMDEETARMFEQTGTYLVPTFLCYDAIIFGNEQQLAMKSPQQQEKLRYYKDVLTTAREIIRESNIKLGYGTDLMTVHQCYESWHEYESWMNSGMDPFRILKAATKNNAEILRMDHRIGTIEPGKYADISGWHRDLLTDPAAISECDFVMKEGRVYPTVYSTD